MENSNSSNIVNFLTIHCNILHLFILGWIFIIIIIIYYICRLDKELPYLQFFGNGKPNQHSGQLIQQYKKGDNIYGSINFHEMEQNLYAIWLYNNISNLKIVGRN